MRQCERIVLTDGRIYTPDGSVRSAVIEDGRLTWLGDKVPGEMLNGSRVIRLDDRAVLPGFSDSCAQLMRWAASHEQIRLDDCASLGDIKAVLSDFADIHPIPRGGWYQGYGWGGAGCPELLRRDIDAVIPDIPVVLWRRGGRTAAVNTAALIAAGITRDTRVKAGEIRLGTDGEPDGILVEAAAVLVARRAVQSSDSELLRILKTYSPRAAACGITEISADDISMFTGGTPGNPLNWLESCDDSSASSLFSPAGAGSADFHRMISFYMSAAESGELPVRIRLSFRIAGIDELRSFLALGWRTGDGIPMCRIGAVKIVCDGSLGDGRALCRDIVRHAVAQDVMMSGMELISQSELDEIVMTARMSGMQVELQADGDAALDMCLNALERAGSCRTSGMRDVIITSGMADESQLDRMRKLRVGAVVRPQSIALQHNGIGADAAKRIGRWKSIVSRGIVTSAGSGAPDGDINPISVLNAAAEHLYAPDDISLGILNTERLTPHEALSMYAWNAAWNGRCEGRRGEAASGRDADLVVLSGDPFSCSDMSDIRAEMTICAGRITYNSGKLFQAGD